MRIGGMNHPFDRGHEEIMHVERIGMVHANLIQNLAEHLQVLGGGTRPQWTGCRILGRSGR